ncbi:hypothetical protein QFC21_003483 [Naganishia friedmannii]|uniref:Uncharacterized protein n=1 Tax=Naganishia friedmannii TaxID=89922 RepID=A0ACC2VQG7_9TREE|nr:hypothetical protein QFC21_003483 [Naganishia friedmannii]
MPQVEDIHGVKGGFWALEKGFELMAHCTKRIPGGHIYYQVFEGAVDRGTEFQAYDTLRKLDKLLKQYDVAQKSRRARIF